MSKDHDSSLPVGEQSVSRPPLADPQRQGRVPEVRSGVAGRKLPAEIRYAGRLYRYLDGMRYQVESTTDRGNFYIIDIEERECSCYQWQRQGACIHISSIVTALTKAT
jgi:hypothetical protein